MTTSCRAGVFTPRAREVLGFEAGCGKRQGGDWRVETLKGGHPRCITTGMGVLALLCRPGRCWLAKRLWGGLTSSRSELWPSTRLGLRVRGVRLNERHRGWGTQATGPRGEVPYSPVAGQLATLQVLAPCILPCLLDLPLTQPSSRPGVTLLGGRVGRGGIESVTGRRQVSLSIRPFPRAEWCLREKGRGAGAYVTREVVGTRRDGCTLTPSQWRGAG